MTTETTSKKNKTSFILLIVIFIVPVILAKLALEFDWFNKASTNRGQLLNPIIEAEPLLTNAERKWHMLYVIPSECSIECENAIYSIQQVHTAVGREKERVNALFIATEDSEQVTIEKLNAVGGVEVLQKSQQDVNKVFKDTGVNAIFVADTLHNLVLFYPTTQDHQQAIMDSRDMLADLRKLLKLSRIG